VQKLQLYINVCQSYARNTIGSIFFRTRCSSLVFTVHTFIFFSYSLFIVFLQINIKYHLCVCLWQDLSRLGRDLSQVVIIDNSPASYVLHPENAVSIAASAGYIGKPKFLASNLV